MKLCCAVLNKADEDVGCEGVLRLMLDWKRGDELWRLEDELYFPWMLTH